MFRDTVMMLCAVSDPEGTVRRHGKKLLRRIYRNQVCDILVSSVILALSTSFYRDQIICGI